MKFVKKMKEVKAKILIIGAIVAVFLSVVGWLWRDIWLASSTWLLVAAVLTLFAIFLKLD